MMIEDQSGSHLYYVATDYLGSICGLMDAGGNMVEEYSYNAWGNRRDPNDWAQSDTRISFITDRGYTGHEMLTQFGLINMNGRVYDPAVGRFLSPDPIVQTEGGSQGMNAYSYALNNPLKYTDPTGYRTYGNYAPATGAVGNNDMSHYSYFTVMAMNQWSNYLYSNFYYLGGSYFNWNDFISSRSVNRKIDKFRRKEIRIGKRTGLEGQNLRDYIYQNYWNRNWTHIDISGNYENGSGASEHTWYLVGDLLDYRNQAEASTRSINITKQISGVENEGDFITPYNTVLPANSNGQITVRNGGTSMKHPNTVSISIGTDVINGQIQGKKDIVLASFETTDRTDLSVNVTINPDNQDNLYISSGKVQSYGGIYYIDIIGTQTIFNVNTPQEVHYNGSFQEWVDWKYNYSQGGGY